MKIEEQIRIAENRTKLLDILGFICDNYVLDVDDIFTTMKDYDVIEARQIFIGICHLKLNFNQTEISRMVGLSQPHTHRSYCNFLEDLEINSQTKEIYQNIITTFNL